MVGDMYEFVGAPVSWCKGVVADMVREQGWQAVPTRRVQRGNVCTWFVRFASGTAPGITCMQNTEDAKLISVRKAAPLERAPRKELHWKRSSAAGSWAASAESRASAPARPAPLSMDVDSQSLTAPARPAVNTEPDSERLPGTPVGADLSGIPPKDGPDQAALIKQAVAAALAGVQEQLASMQRDQAT